MKRESFKSRLGFLLVSAGCAIGIGNVWRFPYVAGQNGGGFFVLLYLIFLVSMGEIRKVECTANHLADQYSEELYYGVAVSADRCGTACEKSIPYGISGRNRTCGVIYRILGL